MINPTPDIISRQRRFNRIQHHPLIGVEYSKRRDIYNLFFRCPVCGGYNDQEIEEKEKIECFECETVLRFDLKLPSLIVQQKDPKFMPLLNPNQLTIFK